MEVEQTNKNEQRVECFSWAGWGAVPAVSWWTAVTAGYCTTQGAVVAHHVFNNAKRGETREARHTGSKKRGGWGAACRIFTAHLDRAAAAVLPRPAPAHARGHQLPPLHMQAPPALFRLPCSCLQACTHTVTRKLPTPTQLQHSTPRARFMHAQRCATARPRRRGPMRT